MWERNTDRSAFVQYKPPFQALAPPLDLQPHSTAGITFFAAASPTTNSSTLHHPPYRPALGLEECKVGQGLNGKARGTPDWFWCVKGAWVHVHPTPPPALTSPFPSHSPDRGLAQSHATALPALPKSLMFIHFYLFILQRTSFENGEYECY